LTKKKPAIMAGREPSRSAGTTKKRRGRRGCCASSNLSRLKPRPNRDQKEAGHHGRPGAVAERRHHEETRLWAEGDRMSESDGQETTQSLSDRIEDEGSPNIFDHAIIVGLVMLVVVPTLPHGAVAPWTQGVLFLFVSVLFACWLLSCTIQGRIRIVRTSAWFFLLAFPALASFHLVSFSPAVLAKLSPAAYETYCRTLPGYPESGEARSLSLVSHDTTMAIRRFLVIAAAFFLALNTIHARGQVLAIVLAVLGIATFEALYGLGERFSGHEHIFWIPKERGVGSVTGTFANRNHFAGLIEMALPLSIGLLVSLRRDARTSPSIPPGAPFRVKLAHALSSPQITKQLLVAAIAVVLLLGLFFSLSRAGALSAFVALAGFAILLSTAKRERRYSVVVLVLVGLFLAAAAEIGIERFATRFSSEAFRVGWNGRWDLYRHAVPYVHDFLFLGSGFGTFGAVYPRYQSTLLGDRRAFSLHNDWMQLVCETGVVGAAIVVLGLALFVLACLRLIRGRRDPFSKWIAAGAFLGMAAMMVHSIFDFNLYKITSNAILFAILLALAWVASRLQSSRKGSENLLRCWTISLRPKAARWLVGGSSLVIPFIGYCTSVPAIEADLAAKRHLASIGFRDRYHFLPLELAGTGAEPTLDNQHSEAGHLEAALQRVLHHPQYLWYAAVSEQSRAWRALTTQARLNVGKIFGPEAEQADPSALRELVVAIAAELEPGSVPDCVPRFRRAQSFLLAAIDSEPTEAKYHKMLAAIESRLDPCSKEIEGLIDRALWLAPNKPQNQFHCGKILLRRMLAAKTPDASASEPAASRDDGAEGAADPVMARVRQCFLDAIRAEPSYAGRAHALISRAEVQGLGLEEVTPLTLRAQEALYRALYQSGEWESALKALDEIERLAKAEQSRGTSSFAALMKNTLSGAAPDVVPEDEAEGPTGIKGTDEDAGPADQEDPEDVLPGAAAHDRRTPLQIGLSVARRRAVLLGLLRRWDERGEAARQCRDRWREAHADELERAKALRGKGRVQEALAIYLRLLETDWSNAEALLSAAEIASLPGMPEFLTGEDTALDFLRRLVVHDQRLSSSRYERAVNVLDSIGATEREATKLDAKLVRAALAVRSHPSSGIELLEDLLQENPEQFRHWRDRHLPGYYLGLGYQKMGKPAQAARAYRQAVDALPSHLASLQRLRDLVRGRPALKAPGPAAVAVPEESGGRDGDDLGVGPVSRGPTTGGGDTPGPESGEASSTGPQVPEIDVAALDEQIDRLRPRAGCSVPFGGKVVLLGYDLDRQKKVIFRSGDPSVEDTWAIVCYWHIREGLRSALETQVEIYDGNWQRLAVSRRTVQRRGRPYFARSGEVVRTEHQLDGFADQDAQFLGVLAVLTGTGRSARLRTDIGEATLKTTVLLDRGTDGPAETEGAGAEQGGGSGER